MNGVSGLMHTKSNKFVKAALHTSIFRAWLIPYFKYIFFSPKSDSFTILWSNPITSIWRYEKGQTFGESQPLWLKSSKRPSHHDFFFATVPHIMTFHRFWKYTTGVFRSQNLPQNLNFLSHQNHIETLNIAYDTCMEY